MKEKFEDRRLTGNIKLTLSNGEKWEISKGDLCWSINSIVNRYRNQGYTLTLRQLYYQLVASDVIRNDDVVYKKLSGVLDDLRYSGMIDWSAIEDRGRVPYLPYSADNIPDAMGDIIAAYRLNRMQGQPTYTEVWTEKDAISGILKEVTSEFHVQLVVNKGYSSSSAMHSAYTRFAGKINDGQKVQILYFGDHDPSGLDMVRDVRDRILFFLAEGSQMDMTDDMQAKFNHYVGHTDVDFFDLANMGWVSEYDVMKRFDSDDSSDKCATARFMYFINENYFEVVPIGLTMDQIKEFNPPPNPAKISDPRAKWYIEQHGPVSWEVDALRPDVMTGIVRSSILATLDQEMFDKVIERENIDRLKMKEFAKSFENQ